MYVHSKIPLQILQDYCSKSCKTLVWFLHARLCTVHILHGSKTCKKSCKGRLARLLQGLVRLWPLLLQYARFLSKYIRFSCKMCQILMQASLQASCKSLMYGNVSYVISLQPYDVWTHTKTSCKILHESYTILASWILHSLAIQNLARLMQDHQDSCIMEKILQFQLVKKSWCKTSCKN